MKTKFIALVCFCLLASAFCPPASAQGTAFTYQGRLSNNGNPASGTYNLTFSLFNANTGGVPIAGPVTNNAVGVTNGLFTVLVDFGPGVFTGQTNWLEISVATNGVSTFTSLAPRLQLTPVPYAIFANGASNLLGMLPAVQLSGALPAAQLSGTILAAQLPASVITNGASGVNISGNISGNGNGLTNLNATKLTGSVSNINNLYLPATTAGAGIIYSGGSTLIHSYGSQNIFAGSSAGNLTMGGSYNSGFGAGALFHNTSGSYNTASGYQALYSNTNGQQNTANGYRALQANTSGYQNTAIGDMALQANTSGGANVAIGFQALQANTNGINNTALGYSAGFFTTGSYNIDIGSPGVAGESNTIRIGALTYQSNTYITGIYNAIASGGLPVYVTSGDKLGIITSSRRFKEDIQDMGHASDALLSLHPVTFKYKPDIDPQGIPQFGLVAEEVEGVDPDLVVHDRDGKPYSVRYEQVSAMLLNEFLKEHKKVETQSAEIQNLEKKLDELQAEVKQLATQKGGVQ